MAGSAALRRASGWPRFARFVLVGGVNTAVHGGLYLVLWLVLPYLGAHLVAVTAAMCCSYVLNCRFTFRVRPTLGKLLLYPASNVVNIGLSTTAVYVLVESFAVDSRIATILGGIAAIPATFAVSRLILVGAPAASRRGSRDRREGSAPAQESGPRLPHVRESPEEERARWQTS